MVTGWQGFPIGIFIAVCLVLLPACRKPALVAPAEIPIPPPDEFIEAQQKQESPIYSNAVEIHRAAQEMALDGFQFDKSELGWPFDIQAASVTDYLHTLILGGFLPPEAAAWITEDWKMANLSDADSGETAFLHINLADNALLVIRKDGNQAVFIQGSPDADVFAKVPTREPAWLEK